MAGKKTGTAFDITALFEQELQARNEDLRRQAAMTMFFKLHPTNKTTVEEFITSLKQHKDVWAAVSTMGIIDFVEAIGGKRPTESKPGKAAAKRTRLSEAQKNSLKGIITSVLSNAKDGLSRGEIADNINNELLANVGVDRAELANKLRQPLGELVADNKIHTIGEKRLMKYHNGPGKKEVARPKQPFSKSSSGFTNRGPLCYQVASRMGRPRVGPSNIRLRVPSCFCSSSPDADTTEEDKESWQEQNEVLKHVAVATASRPLPKATAEVGPHCGKRWSKRCVMRGDLPPGTVASASVISAACGSSGSMRQPVRLAPPTRS